MKSSFSILFIIMFFYSCTNYVNNLHRKIDYEEKMASGAPKEKVYDPYAVYKKNPRRGVDSRPIQNPRTYSLSDGGPSGQLRTPTPKDPRSQRSKANDFIDSDNSGSLWASNESNVSLFTNQNEKRSGDMVIINVLENLRNQISSELKRAFPDNPKKTSGESKPGPKTQAPGTGQSAAADNEMDMKIYDKISGTVIEEISKDYILLSGRKNVIFKKEKRSIEVQGLASRKDILENDYVNSDKLLDIRVLVLGRNK